MRSRGLDAQPKLHIQRLIANNKLSLVCSYVSLYENKDSKRCLSPNNSRFFPENIKFPMLFPVLFAGFLLQRDCHCPILTRGTHLAPGKYICYNGVLTHKAVLLPA